MAENLSLLLLIQTAITPGGLCGIGFDKLNKNPAGKGSSIGQELAGAGPAQNPNTSVFLPVSEHTVQLRRKKKGLLQQSNKDTQAKRGEFQQRGEQEKPSYKMLMALCPEEDQLAVLAFATLPERKQVAETGTLASGRPSAID
ncbi:hypothetical protein Anapl_12606 [Anas platyrhynchos]|uniref:Uncharacterized protein n=1 Tax=Anas platyrhynchos TaxID=8839 RepID=R0M016_ANAPL|nr:hypothetical protein Anapl_12606 [Anas platyrhynchos]